MRQQGEQWIFAVKFCGGIASHALDFGDDFH
jgi:hypothetical protein